MHKFRQICLKGKTKTILNERGYSFAFNESDFELFKEQAKGDPFLIAELFIQDCMQPSDFEPLNQSLWAWEN